MGTPSSILKSVGFPSLPITLSDLRLSNHILNQKNHNVILGNFKNLVEAIHNPIALFKDKDYANRIHILTHLTNSRKESIQVFIELEKDFGGRDKLGYHQELKVSSMITAFAPNDSFTIEKHIIENDSLYRDKERLINYLQGFRQHTKFVYPKTINESSKKIEKVLYKIQEFSEKCFSNHFILWGLAPITFLIYQALGQVSVIISFYGVLHKSILY